MGRKRRLINNPKFTRKNSGHPIVRANAITKTELPNVKPIIEAAELQTISSTPVVEAPTVEKVVTPAPTIPEKKPVVAKTPDLKVQPKTVSKTKTTVRPTKARTSRRKTAATKSIS